MADRNVRVLVVDDSKVAQLLLRQILESDPQIQVIGAVASGHAALQFVQELTPDAVLMDIEMPGIDGFETTRRIMESHPVPIVICTGTTNPLEVATTFRVMEAGAVACVEKPVGPEHPRYAEMAATLRQTVRLMSEVKVVRRWARSRAVRPPAPRPVERTRDAVSVRIVAMGASTGGPPVLQTILSGLPKDFGVPILIVQHIARGFLPGLADWLHQTSAFQIHIGAYGVEPLAGHVYLAPDDYHMGVSPSGRILLTREPPENNLRPSASVLFRSVAQVYGASVIGVLLTGMGKDGAAELAHLKETGAVTIAQDRETSVVHGMPGEAIMLGGVTHVLPAEKIAGAIVSIVNRRNGQETES